MPPCQLSLDGFEERLDGGIVVTIAFAAHGHLEAILAQDFLVVVGSILRPAICVMNAAFGRLSERDCHPQSPDRKVAFHPIADSPANDAP